MTSDRFGSDPVIRDLTVHSVFSSGRNRPIADTRIDKSMLGRERSPKATMWRLG